MQVALIFPRDTVQEILEEIDRLLKDNDDWIVNNINIDCIDKQYSGIVEYEEQLWK